MRRKGKGRFFEEGQGLVEYAMVLILVGIIVILVLAVFGNEVTDVYCQAVYSVDSEADIDRCQQVEIDCVVHGIQPGQINVEAVVTDNAGEIDEIERVKFSLNGIPRTNTEFEYQYCYAAGNTCGYTSISSGTHTISAVATDTEGNTGQCEVEVNIP